MSLPEHVVSTFLDHFGYEPAFLVRAPGRVNLIGEHTDYNDGFVFPMAIDRNVWIAASPRTDLQVKLYSLDFPEPCNIDLSTFAGKANGWGLYVQGVAWSLERSGFSLQGWEGVVGSNVPIGSGLSSSAALELAVARCIAQISGAEWNPVAMAKHCQMAENEWVGMNCGIMDQLIVSAGQRGKALLIDCRSLVLKAVPLSPDASIVIMDTGTRRGLVDSAYNERRAQCEASASFFEVSFLRDVSMNTFEGQAHRMEEGLRKRCRHVISENERTVAAAEALKAQDFQALGRLMSESHDSLRDDYEVTNDELNIIVDLARDCEGVYGARMTGAGFGGCAIALVKEAAAQAFIMHIERAYYEKTGIKPALYACKAEHGVDVENIV